MVYMEFAEKMRSLKDEFDLAVSVFLTDYLNSQGSRAGRTEWAVQRGGLSDPR